MPDQIEEIVRSLPDTDDVRGLWEVAELRLADGDAAFVGDLGVALVRAFGAHGGIWQYRSVFDRLLLLLTGADGSDGAGDVRQVLRLVAERQAVAQPIERYAASLLATFQLPAELAPAFSGGAGSVGASNTLRACLIHELVLRHVDVASSPGTARWATSGAALHHPLGWLPLALAEFEEGRGLPHYGVSGHGSNLPFGEAKGPTWSGAEAASASVPARETTTDDDTAAVSTAVQNWAEESNGRFEVRVFDLDQPGAPVEPAALAATLPALGIACVGDSRVTLTACDLRQAWRELFAAASDGGAYNSGGYGAYGRLHAWRSLGGLAGAASWASAADVAAAAQEASWFSLDRASKWFEGVAWDLGLVAVRGSRVAVLGATDTD